MKHKTDDGDLSVFSNPDQILLACTGGHFWIIDAKQKELPETPSGATGLDKEEPDGLEGFDRAAVLRALKKFG